MSPSGLDKLATRASVPTGAEVTGKPDVYRGEVSRVVGLNVFVIVPAFSGRREHGPGFLIAPAGLPSVGDTAYVLFADSRVPVVLVPGVADWTIGAMEDAYAGLTIGDLEGAAGSIGALEHGAR